MRLVRLRADPMGVTTQGPTSDGTHKSLLIAQAADQVRNQLGQVRYHTAHAACDQSFTRIKLCSIVLELGASLQSVVYLLPFIETIETNIRTFGDSSQC